MVLERLPICKYKNKQFTESGTHQNSQVPWKQGNRKRRSLDISKAHVYMLAYTAQWSCNSENTFPISENSEKRRHCSLVWEDTVISLSCPPVGRHPIGKQPFSKVVGMTDKPCPLP